MTGYEDESGQEQAQVWIPFGDAPGQMLHPGTAEAVLRMLAGRHPGQFGGLLAEALTGERPKARRSS